ncbi:hypothetical protein [Allochromatium tepidum]|uniref:Uncharacterized protein n=1 Tax=Allochromatium tepidum TaxID=553982 RepID=A0ABN6GGK3_9GAMM|nr:hypothetical protein [Allochromatium tepidum]BCU08478.1 hypothetical protein Atep_31550 [Allochromatium tepidum]
MAWIRQPLPLSEFLMVEIMQANGKASKVLIAAVRREPVAHIGEGSDHAARRRPSLGPYGQRLTARQVESLHLFPAAARS